MIVGSQQQLGGSGGGGGGPHSTQLPLALPFWLFLLELPFCHIMSSIADSTNDYGDYDKYSTGL